MKKIEKAGQVRNAGQKLKLARETLRLLEATQLPDVVGGTVATCVGTTCHASKSEILGC